VSTAGAEAQGLLERVRVKAGPSWTAAEVTVPRTDRRYTDQGRSVFLALETRPLVGPFGLVLELGHVERSGPALYSLYLVTPGAGPSVDRDETTRYGFGSVTPLARVRLVDGPVRVYALAGPRVGFDLGTNLPGAYDVMVELTGGVGVELPGAPMSLEARGSVGLTDLALDYDEVHTRALDLLLGLTTAGRGGLAPDLMRRVSLKSGVTWGTTAARFLEPSASGRRLAPFWSGFLAVETRAIAGPVSGVLELGFVQRGFAYDRWPFQAHKDAAPSVAALARVRLGAGASGVLYALAGPRVVLGGEDGVERVHTELTAGLGFDPSCLPVFIEARANASVSDAVPHPDPRWPAGHDAGSYHRALDLFVGFNLIER
jgi:hypothetical protein